jgi:hypothetical protein
MVGCSASGFALTTPYGPLQVSSGGEGMGLSTAHGGPPNSYPRPQLQIYCETVTAKRIR